MKFRPLVWKNIWRRKFRTIFQDYSSRVTPKSIDEAIIDFRHGFINRREFMQALWLSTEVAFWTAVASTVIGTAASLALVRGRFRGRDALNAQFKPADYKARVERARDVDARLDSRRHEATVYFLHHRPARGHRRQL